MNRTRIYKTDEEAYLEGSSDEDEKTLSGSTGVQMASQNELRSPRIPPAEVKPNDSDALDSLEAFMQKINSGMLAEAPPRKKEEERFDQTDVDSLADYVLALEAAREAAEKDEDDEDDGCKSVRPLLPRVDHKSISYLPFQPNIYKEHSDISNMPIAAQAEYRAENKISVVGFKVPQAISDFSQLKQTLERKLLSNVREQGWSSPTPIQSQLIPAALSGNDVIAVAETGSGKTGAYLIAAIQHTCKVLDQLNLVCMPLSEGPLVLILAPTRELAAQIFGVARSLTAGLKLRVSCFSGGYEKTQQFKEIVAGFEICIGNPGRVVDLGTMRGGLTFKHITLFILDEVDRMLDLGFHHEVLSIKDSLRPDRQVLVLSATLPPSLEALCESFTHKPIKVTVGYEGQAGTNVEQRPVVFPDEKKKADWIVANIHKLIHGNKQILIFCKSHGRTLDLSAVINSLLEQSPSSPDSHHEEFWDAHTGQLRGVNKSESETHLAPAFARLSQNISDDVTSRIDLLDRESQKQSPGVISSAPVIGIQNKFTRIYSRHLFGEMNQAERQAVLKSFRKNKFPVLVASDVAARGLDIPNVAIVVNYDAALQLDTHIHRIGRAGRAGNKGIAYSLLTKQDNKIAGLIVETMQRSGQEVPKPVLQLAMTFEPFRASQLAGTSYASRMRLKQGNKKSGDGALLSSSGLGYGSAESLAKSGGGFVLGRDSTSTKRRWDAAAHSESLAKKKSRFSQPTSAATLHIEADESEFKKPLRKVFNPGDEIPSSSEDELQKKPVGPSLLKPRNRLSGSLAAARARATSAAQTLLASKAATVAGFPSSLLDTTSPFHIDQFSSAPSIEDGTKKSRWN